MLAKVPVQPNQTPKHTLFTKFQMDVKVGQSGRNICPTRQKTRTFKDLFLFKDSLRVPHFGLI